MVGERFDLKRRPNGLIEVDQDKQSHFESWFKLAYGVSPAMRYPEFAVSVVRALHAGEFETHAGTCRMRFSQYGDGKIGWHFWCEAVDG